MTAVELVYFNAGGGHRSAAFGLRDAFALRPEPSTVHCLDLVDLLDPHGRFEAVTGFAPEVYYNKRLARGWTLGLAQELKLLQGIIRLGHKAMVRQLARHWERSRPDIVVSLIPNFNLALQESLALALPGVPFVVVLTDMADLPPNFWMESPAGQHIVCGTGRAVEQAFAMGHERARVHRTSGMIIRPDFYTPMAIERAEEFERLGLDPSRPTGVVMFGGEGSSSMLKISRALDDLQLILMCGRNGKLADSLRALPSTAPRAIVGFTAEVRRYLSLADFFVGKPGPGSISEALHVGLPIITTLNSWTMPQERFNARWVHEQQLGIVVPSLSQIRSAAHHILRRLPEFKRNVTRMENTAVFEVPSLLARIVDARESVSPGPAEFLA